MKADRTVILIGVFLFLLGLVVAWQAYGYIQIERGWAMVISGVTGASAGIVLVALGLVLNQLQKISSSAAQAVLFLSKLKAVAETTATPFYAPSVAANAVAPVEPFAPPPRESQPIGGFALAGAAAGLAGVALAGVKPQEAKAQDAGAPEAEPPKLPDYVPSEALARAEDLAPPEPSWHEYAPKPPAWMTGEAESRDFELLSDHDPSFSVDPPPFVTPKSAEAPRAAPESVEERTPRLIDLSRDWVVHSSPDDADAVAEFAEEAAWPAVAPAIERDDSPVWAEAAPEPAPSPVKAPVDAPAQPAPAPAPATREMDWPPDIEETTSENFALRPALSDEAATVEEASAAELEKENEAPERPAVMGQYEANGARYIMYVDGSIDAETSHGVYHFKSMAELKLFIEQEA